MNNIQHELNEMIKQIEADETLTTIDLLRICNATILASTLINGDFSREYLEELTKLLPSLKLPDYMNVMLTNIIVDKLDKINKE